MNSREIDTEARRLAAERGWDDWSDGGQRSMMLLYLINDREEARRSLLVQIGSLRRDLDHLEQRLQAESPILNTLGELQGRPAHVEAGVGQFAAADMSLKRYLAAYPPKGE